MVVEEKKEIIGAELSALKYYISKLLVHINLD